MLWSELRLILKTSSVTPIFLTFLIESYHFLPSVKVLKKSVCGKYLGANVLNDLDWPLPQNRRKSTHLTLLTQSSMVNQRYRSHVILKGAIVSYDPFTGTSSLYVNQTLKSMETHFIAAELLKNGTHCHAIFQLQQNLQYFISCTLLSYFLLYQY